MPLDSIGGGIGQSGQPMTSPFMIPIQSTLLAGYGSESKRLGPEGFHKKRKKPLDFLVPISDIAFSVSRISLLG
jgi:hypothetical protein